MYDLFFPGICVSHVFLPHPHVPVPVPTALTSTITYKGLSRTQPAAALPTLRPEKTLH